ncbi:hypothetical protein AAC387_Pa10g2189 [Persea americana]
MVMDTGNNRRSASWKEQPLHANFITSLVISSLLHQRRVPQRGPTRPHRRGTERGLKIRALPFFLVCCHSRLKD